MWWRVRQTEICAPDAETVFISLCSSQKPPVKYIFAGRRRRNQIRFCWSPLQHTISQQHMCIYIPSCRADLWPDKNRALLDVLELYFLMAYTARGIIPSTLKYCPLLFFSLKELKEKTFFFFSSFFLNPLCAFGGWREFRMKNRDGQVNEMDTSLSLFYFIFLINELPFFYPLLKKRPIDLSGSKRIKEDKKLLRAEHFAALYIHSPPKKKSIWIFLKLKLFIFFFWVLELIRKALRRNISE